MGGQLGHCPCSPAAAADALGQQFRKNLSQDHLDRDFLPVEVLGRLTQQAVDCLGLIRLQQAAASRGLDLLELAELGK